MKLFGLLLPLAVSGLIAAHPAASTNEQLTRRSDPEICQSKCNPLADDRSKKHCTGVGFEHNPALCPLAIRAGICHAIHDCRQCLGWERPCKGVPAPNNGTATAQPDPNSPQLEARDAAQPAICATKCEIWKDYILNAAYSAHTNDSLYIDVAQRMVCGMDNNYCLPCKGWANCSKPLDPNNLPKQDAISHKTHA